MCLSDAAFDCVKQGEEELGVIAEAKLNARIFQLSSFLCMLALSSILQLPIESYFPMALEKGTNSLSCIQLDHFAKIEKMEGCLEKLHIFHCASLPFAYLQRLIIPSNRNISLPSVILIPITQIKVISNLF